MIREDFMRYDIPIIAAAIVAAWTIGPAAIAQKRGSNEQATTAGPAGNPDQELGRRFLIKAENLPALKSGPIAASRSLLIPYSGQTPRVMEGFTVTPFITGLEHPRRLLVLPNNDVIVAEQKTGYLTLLRLPCRHRGSTTDPRFCTDANPRCAQARWWHRRQRAASCRSTIDCP